MTSAVYQDKNGIVYLSIEQDIRIAKGRRGHKFIVNKGKSIDLVSIDYESMTSLALIQLEKIPVSNVVNRLLSPLNPSATMDSSVELLLRKILEKEAEMATKKPVATATAPVAAPVATKQVPAGKPVAVPAKAKFAAPANAPIKAVATPAQENGEAEPESALYQTVVVATDKGKEAREGSFFRMVHDLSQQPIKLQDLIDTITNDGEFVLKSEKDRASVIKTRTRDAFTRLGYLQAAAGH